MVRLRGGGRLDELHRLRSLVERENACSLPGCTIDFVRFSTVLRRAMSRGYVKDVYGEFVLEGLSKGFTLGVSMASLKGRRVFKNYPATYANRSSMSNAIYSRVERRKSLHLGPSNEVFAELNRVYPDYYCFPMNAVPKPHKPSEMRPTSDHTRTGFNAATIMGVLNHSLNTYKETAYFLKTEFTMRVSDVEDAFPHLPLAPWLWVFFLFRWFASPAATVEDVFCHLFADFGTRGMPGTFKIFFVDVVVRRAVSSY